MGTAAADGTHPVMDPVRLRPGGYGRRWEAIPRPRRTKVDRTDPDAVQDARDDARAERHRLRRLCRPLWRTDRVKGCGMSGARPDGETTLRYTPGADGAGAVAGMSGLMSCGNVWLCPECAQKVAARRAARLEAALLAAVERGGWAVLVTLTLRHHERDTLRRLLRDGVRKGWSSITRSRAWGRLRRDLGILGTVRAIEITHGENGWHPHVHAIVIFDRPPTGAQVAELGRTMFGAWSRAIVRAGLPAPVADAHGLDVSQLGAGTREGVYASLAAWSRYAVKGLTGETVLGVVKDAKGTNRSVRQLMTDAVIGTTWVSDDGRKAHTLDDTARGLLAEYERETKAVKWLTGLAELERALGLDADETTDEDVAAEDAGGEDVAVIAGGYFDTLVEPVLDDLLSACERYGPEGARRWLDRHGVPWTMPVAGAGRTWSGIAEERDRETRRLLADDPVGTPA